MSLKIKTPPKSKDGEEPKYFISHEEFKMMKVLAYRKVAQKVIEQYCMLDIYEHPESYNPEIVKMIEKLQKKNEKQENKLTQIFLLTVNPNENSKYDWDIDKFHHLIKKCVSKPWIKQYMYCIETRGEVSSDEEGNNLFHGIHAHILIDRGDYSPSHTLREIWSTFRKLYDTDMATKYSTTIYSSPVFNYKPCTDPTNFIRYIQGVKDGQPKSNAQTDAIMRADEALAPFYVRGFGFPLEIEELFLTESDNEDQNTPPTFSEQCLTDIPDTNVVTTTTTNQLISAPRPQHILEQSLTHRKYAL